MGIDLISPARIVEILGIPERREAIFTQILSLTNVTMEDVVSLRALSVFITILELPEVYPKKRSPN